MCVYVCARTCVCVYPCDSVKFNRMKRKLRQSKQGENLCWHSAATRWPVNANFNNSLIVGVRALLDHFVLCEQARRSIERERGEPVR